MTALGATSPCKAGAGLLHAVCSQKIHLGTDARRHNRDQAGDTGQVTVHHLESHDVGANPVQSSAQPVGPARWVLGSHPFTLLAPCLVQGLSRRKVMERPSPASPQPVALVAAAQAAAAPSALLSMAEHADLSQRGPAQPLAAGSGAGGTQQPRPLLPAPFSSQHSPSTY